MYSIFSYFPQQDTTNLTKVLKEKLEYRPKSCVTDTVSVTTNVSDRLGKLKDASGYWKNRVEAKDAEKYTVAAKTINQPAELPFKKSEVRQCPPMVDFQCANPSPMGLAKSSSMATTNIGLKLPLPAYTRSVSMPSVGEENCSQSKSVKVVVPNSDEDKLFDKFFTSMSPQVETKLEAVSEWDLDAITSTQRWVFVAKTFLPNPL